MQVRRDQLQDRRQKETLVKRRKLGQLDTLNRQGLKTGPRQGLDGNLLDRHLKLIQDQRSLLAQIDMTGSHLAWRPLVVGFHCPTLWCRPKERAKVFWGGPLNFFILFYTNERKGALAVTPLVRSRSRPWSRARKTPAAKGSVRGTSRFCWRGWLSYSWKV